VIFMCVYHEIESEAKNFLFISSAAFKDKSHKTKSAQKVLDAIEEYKKLPLELRNELERNKNNHVSKIVELEKLCRGAVK
jgi:hypothetical protein